MEFISRAIPGLMLIKPRVFADQRGHFFESFNAEAFGRAGLPMLFAQDNQSLSARGVIRGLHFQHPPHGQGKLVRVVRGGIIDVAIDLRKGSPTFGQHDKVELTEGNHLMFWIPEGFAHGFVALEDHTLVSYKCTRVYDAAAEGSLRWNDPDLGIDWGELPHLMSDRDKEAPLFADFETPFDYE